MEDSYEGEKQEENVQPEKEKLEQGGKEGQKEQESCKVGNIDKKKQILGRGEGEDRR